MTDKEKFVAANAFKTGWVAGVAISIPAFFFGYIVGVLL